MNTPTPVPVDALSAENLRAVPVWQYLLDAEGEGGVDESHVTPAAGPPQPGGHGSFVVSATFELSSGQRLPGAVQLDQLGPKRYFTPVLLFAGGKRLDPLARDVGIRISRLTKTADTRPVRWQLDLCLPGDRTARSGRNPGFRSVLALGLLARLLALRFTKRSA